MRAIYLRSLLFAVCLAAFALVEALAPRASAAGTPARTVIGGVHRPA